MLPTLLISTGTHFFQNFARLLGFMGFCENAELSNTEVFSKVSQSLALVNSVSTLLNKGESHADVLRLLRTSVLQQNKHKLSQPLCSSLVPHDTSEARVGGNQLQAKLQSNTHFFMDAHRHRQVLQSSSYANANYQSMPKHAPAMFMLVHAQTVKVCENSVHAKVSSRKYATRLLLERA